MRPFTPATAPRQGGKLGRKNKLSAQAMQILDRLLADWTKHGAATLRILRRERPDLYARLAVETAARLTLADSAGDADGPVIVTVRWVDPKHSAPPPLPPEPPRPINSSPHPPPFPQLLTFRRPLD
jgi:hypothetical protein